MKRLGCAWFAAVLGLGLASGARADDAAARAVVEKGLKAIGGAENVAKLKAVTFKMKGTFYGMGLSLPYTGTWMIDAQTRMRYTIESEINGMRFTFTRVFDGTKGRMKMNDMTTELNADQVAEAKHELYSMGVQMLLPLVKDKEYTLAPLGESEVEKRPAVGVRVTRKGQRDINLYFDKESALLVKSESLVREEETGKEVQQEEFFSNYKEIDGVKHAMKGVVKREGKLFVEGETTELTPSDKLDDGLFGKP